MAESDFDEDDDDEYFAEVVADYDPTGKEPKFVMLPALNVSPYAISEMKVDELVQMYRDVRDQLGTERKAFKAREARIKTHLEVLSMTFTEKANALGVDAFPTSAGTAYRTKVERFPILDWAAFCEWILRTKNFQVLQKRTSPVAVREIRQGEGRLPDGVGSVDNEGFSVRKPTVRKR